MISAGIDVGSVSTKVVLLDGNEIKAMHIVPTKADPNLAAETAMNECLKVAGVTQKDVGYTVTTGYGRRAIDYGDRALTEITANAKGAVFLGSPAGQVRTIIDLGGQDSKVISLDEEGKIMHFLMNDKCAAGTGRFLEVMANALGVTLNELGNISLKSNNPLKINSTCTVFAESEVVSLIARRMKKEDIIAGLHYSITKKISSMAKEVGVKEVVFFDGGGAKNVGIKDSLEKHLGVKLYVPDHPQTVVALGAALFASELMTTKKPPAPRPPPQPPSAE